MKTKIKGSEKNTIGRGVKKMNKQNNNTDHSTKLYDWLYDSPDLDAISYYTDFDEKNKKWRCKFLNITFSHIFRCKDCMKCQKQYKKLMNKLAKEQEEQDIEYFLDEELLEDEKFFEDGIDDDQFEEEW